MRGAMNGKDIVTRAEQNPPDAYDPGTIELSPRDRSLMSCVKDVLSSHAGLRHLKLAVVVRGGVAHVKGSVASEAERSLLRKTISRIRGIHAVWDILAGGDGKGPRMIDIGCGVKKQAPGAVGVDRHPHPGVDIVADLERRLPFADRGTDHVFAVHVLEHVHNLIGLMNEIHRILKPTGVLHAMVPNPSCVNSIADPTHIRFFNTQTFKYFCKKHPGLCAFRPGLVSCDRHTVFADLYPVQDDGDLPTDEELSYFFD